MGCIYRITNTINQKIYIGRSVDFQKRKNRHLSSMRRNKQDNPYLQNAFNKYGEEAFVFEIVEDNVADDKLVEREQYWLDTTKSYEPEIGYNINALSTDGALPGKLNHFYGKHHTDEAKAKTGASAQGHKRWLGKHHTQETKDKMSEIHAYKVISPEVRATMGRSRPQTANQQEAIKKACNKQIVELYSDRTYKRTWGSIGEAAKHYGNALSTLSLALKRNTLVKNSQSYFTYADIDNLEPRKKPVCQYDINDVLIAEFDSITEAGKAISVAASTISYCLSGRQLSAGGFKWKYKPQ